MVHVTYSITAKGLQLIRAELTHHRTQTIHSAATRGSVCTLVVDL
eukprot:COSAG02_NODE_12340_length_1560_cov_1.600958_3_plen_44_part_01